MVEQPGGRYRIVAGERRWRAARQAGLATVPCIVRDMDMIRQMEVSLIENLQREDLNPMEEAAAIRALMQQCGYTQETVAARLSKSRPVIANLLRLLTLPKEVAQMVRERFGTQDIRINYVGPVIGAHSGPGTLALFYLGTQR